MKEKFSRKKATPIQALPLGNFEIELVIIGIIIFMSASIAGIYIMSAIQQNVPDDILGRIMSFYSAIVSIALPVGILVYGYLYEKFINHLPVIMF